MTPEAVEYLWKIASAGTVEEASPKTKLVNALKHTGALAVGTLAGAGLAYGADKAYSHYNPGKSIPNKYLLAALPVASVLSSMAYAHSKKKEQEANQHVIQDPSNRKY